MHNEFPVLSGGSGAAFLLDEPAEVSLTLSFTEGSVTIRQGAPFATISLTQHLNQEDAKNEAWRVLQDALDIFAAQRKAFLQTVEGECTYLVWRKDGIGYELVLVGTIDAPWSFSMSLVFESSGVEIPAQSPRPPLPPPPRHPSLRFYRLAHTSADLFDAFRNAYLALECLASEVSPKGASESELNWLKRALAGSLSGGLLPYELTSDTLDDIYKEGRLPTFHAKTGSSFYAPHGPERQSMQTRFNTLLQLVNHLLLRRFGHEVVNGGGSMSQALCDSMAAVTFTYDEIVLKDGKKLVSSPTVVETISSPRRFDQLWGRASIARPTVHHWFDALEVRKEGSSWASCTLDERVPLHGVNKLTLELNLLQYHNRSKRPVHRR